MPKRKRLIGGPAAGEVVSQHCSRIGRAVLLRLEGRQNVPLVHALVELAHPSVADDVVELMRYGGSNCEA